MSQQSSESTSGRDFNARSLQNNPSNAGTDSNDGRREKFGYASHERRRQTQHSMQEYTVPFQEPIAEHPCALLPHQITQTNGDFQLAQTGYDASFQSIDWNNAAFDANRFGESIFGSASYDAPLGFPNGGLGLNFQPTPTWACENIYNYYQPIVPTVYGGQSVPALYPAPAPVGLAGPTTTTNADPIRCPKGCPQTFGRAEELRRHMKKHETPRYKCPIYDCPMTFYRKDKLRDHSKKGHRSRDSLNIS